MKNPTQLIGAQLMAVTLPETAGRSSVTEEVYLQFDSGRLFIHNPCTLRCDSGLTVQFPSIIGSRVTDTLVAPEELVMVFDGRIYLDVSLKEEDFIRPEAAVYYPASGGSVTIP